MILRQLKQGTEAFIYLLVMKISNLRTEVVGLVFCLFSFFTSSDFGNQIKSEKKTGSFLSFNFRNSSFPMAFVP